MNYPTIIKPSTLLAALLFANSPLAQESSVELETVKVSADFRQLDLQQIPSAITVVSEDDIQKRNADHLESILSLAPNVNYSAGASRGRFFQIRGIGERSQFIDPVNPSVGLIIDGVDMTGLGGAATLFDVQQVEILRGPQGTAFGANALAGAINITSKQPTKETEGYVEAKAGNYNSTGLGGAISGSITDSVQGRIAINQITSDGYMENVHLNKDDTNNIDELVARAQINWAINQNNDLNISILKTDINNGYDAFSLDNTRTTYSNNPGQDKQETEALSLNWNTKLNDTLNFELIASGNQTKSDYGFDEDWAYGEYTYFHDVPTYIADPCDTAQGACLADIDGYSSVDQYLRDYKRQILDMRFLSGADGKIFSNSTDWIAGLYTANKEEKLVRNYTYLDSAYHSEIDNNSLAFYTEFTTNVFKTSRLIYGIRIEESSFDFTNNDGLELDQNETLWGGKITFESMLNHEQLGYISIARGFKAGSVNHEPLISVEDKLYETEINHSLEAGLKSSLLNDTLKSNVAVFYINRENQQVKQSLLYMDEGKPKFKEYFSNAGEGKNYGIEAEVVWDVSNYIVWTGSAGLLMTEFVDYEFTDKDKDDNVFTVSKAGRAQAHAPEYSISSSVDFSATKFITFNLETEAKDDYYFSDSHDEKSKAYVLIHANVRYQKDNLALSLNGHNLTNKDYAVRGFGFANDPRNGYTDTQHIQLGAPRLVSLSARYQF
mgnify:FL=1